MKCKDYGVGEKKYIVIVDVKIVHRFRKGLIFYKSQIYFETHEKHSGNHF